MKLTKEDVFKYGTKEEILFLEATKKKKKVCARCGKPLKKGDTGKVCDMCAEDIDKGRDKE
jgi:formylmethanofuran dehydrogenase subunit E